MPKTDAGRPRSAYELIIDDELCLKDGVLVATAECLNGIGSSENQNVLKSWRDWAEQNCHWLKEQGLSDEGETCPSNEPDGPTIVIIPPGTPGNPTGIEVTPGTPGNPLGMEVDWLRQWYDQNKNWLAKSNSDTSVSLEGRKSFKNWATENENWISKNRQLFSPEINQ